MRSTCACLCNTQICMPGIPKRSRVPRSANQIRAKSGFKATTMHLQDPQKGTPKPCVSDSVHSGAKPQCATPAAPNGHAAALRKQLPANPPLRHEILPECARESPHPCLQARPANPALCKISLQSHKSAPSGPPKRHPEDLRNQISANTFQRNPNPPHEYIRTLYARVRSSIYIYTYC